MGITALLNLTLEVSGLAAGAQQILEPVVVWLELVIGHTPILDGEIGVQEPLAIARPGAGSQLEVVGLEAEGLTVPVHHGAAEPGAGQKRLPAPHGESRLRGVVAESDRLARIGLHPRLQPSKPAL